MKLLRELGRIAGRQAHGVRLFVERRKLARLESALGLLGWQQADYEGAAQEEVQRLTAYEREQGRLTNESAGYGIEITKLEEQRASEESACVAAQSAALQQAQFGAENFEALETLLAARRKEVREIAARLPVIERELQDAEKQYRALVGPELPAPEIRAQILQFQRLIMALPREKAEWIEKGQVAEEGAEAMEAVRDELRTMRAAHDARVKEMAAQISECQRSKRKVEKQIEALEKAKANPYREIGRALADNRIAPLNQPDALTAVLTQREKVAGFEAAIAASLAESAREGGWRSWRCWILTGGLIGSEALAFLAIEGQ